MKKQLIAVVGTALLAVAACSTSDPQASSALTTGSDAGRGPVDPTCSTDSFDVERAAPPEGSCVEGATCEFYVQGECGPGIPYIGGAQQYRCNCIGNAWQCDILSGGYGLTLCPDAGTDFDASDASDAGDIDSGDGG